MLEICFVKHSHRWQNMSAVSLCPLLSTCTLSLQDANVISQISTAGSERKRTSDDYTQWLKYACGKPIQMCWKTSADNQNMENSWFLFP